jgi:uncharacterized SAM-binding protein YcdF (DUF218 family)
MFYFLSKVLFYVFMPLPLVVIAICISIFSKNQKRKKRCLWVGLGLIMIFGNGFLANEAMLQWEVPPTDPITITQPFDFGIILTGGMILNKESTSTEIFPDKSADRFIQPLRLYKAGKLKKILISGGITDLTIIKKDVINETIKVAQLLEELGVKKEDILLETKARNTRENALYSIKILKKNSQLGARFILFTSAFHLRRANECFEKAGMKVTPFGTTYYAKARSYTINNLILPREENMDITYHFVHEIMGYLVYKIMGYC